MSKEKETEKEGKGKKKIIITEKSGKEKFCPTNIGHKKAKSSTTPATLISGDSVTILSLSLPPMKWQKIS